MVTLLLLVLGFLLGVALTGVVAWGCFKRLVAPVLERYEKLKREFYTLEDRIKEFEANVARIRKEKVAYEDKYFFADKELKHKMIKTETLEKEILVLKSDVGELTSELATANAMLAKLRSDLERANIGNTMLSNLAKEARLKGEEVVKDVVSLQDKNQSLRLELQELKDVLTAKTEQYAKDLSTVTNQRDLVILENEKLVFEVRELKCLVEQGILRHDLAVKNTGELTLALQFLDKESGGDKEVVDDMRKLIGEGSESVDLEGTDVFNKPTQKLNPSVTVKFLPPFDSREFAGVAETVKLSVPFGADNLVSDSLESIEGFSPEGVFTDSFSIVKESEKSQDLTEEETLEILVGFGVLPQKIRYDITDDDIDSLFDEKEYGKIKNWTIFSLNERCHVLQFLSSEIAKKGFDELNLKSSSDVISSVIEVIQNVFSSFFDLTQIKPTFFETVLNSEKSMDLEKKLVTCADKILGVCLNNKFKQDQSGSGQTNKVFFLKKVAHSYFLVSAMGSAKHLPWIVKFQYLFFEIVRIQMSQCVSKMDFFKTLVLRNDFDFLNKFKIVNKLQVMKEIGTQLLFSEQDKGVLVEAVEVGGLIDVFARIHKKAQGLNEGGNVVLMKDLESFMFRVVMSFEYSEELVSAKAN